MFFRRFDVWAGVGVTLSSILSAYAWLYSIGLVPLFTFIAGACFTLLTQERLERKRRERAFDIKMTEHIYGPLHRVLSLLLIDLRAFGSPTGKLQTLRGIMQDYRYSFVPEKLQDRLEKFEKSLQPYASLLSKSRRETQSSITRSLGVHKIHGDIIFELWGGEQTLRINIMELIFNDKTPLDYLTKKVEDYGEFSIIVHVGGKSEGRLSSEHRIQQISKEILEEVRKDPKVQQQRKERERLLKELSFLIDSITEKIVLS